jgi:hypothetical protein
MKKVITALSFLTALMGSQVCSAAPYFEVNDAGHTLSTVQEVTGGTTTIYGNLQASDAADVYKFYWNGGVFSATANTGFDPMLFLFNTQGNLLAFNDDYFGVQSHISTFLNAGKYLLGIDRYSLNYGGQLSGFSAAGSSFNSYYAPYQIDISETTSAIPEPTTVALLGLGLLAFATSRRKSAKSKNA